MASRHVLDAAAVLCLLDDAPGADRIAEVLDTASISSVSVALVAAELTRRGADPQEVKAILGELHLNVVAFGFDQSIEASTFGFKTTDEGSMLEAWAWSSLASKAGAMAITGRPSQTRA